MGQFASAEEVVQHLNQLRQEGKTLEIAELAAASSWPFHTKVFGFATAEQLDRVQRGQFRKSGPPLFRLTREEAVLVRKLKREQSERDRAKSKAASQEA